MEAERFGNFFKHRGIENESFIRRICAFILGVAFAKQTSLGCNRGFPFEEKARVSASCREVMLRLAEIPTSSLCPPPLTTRCGMQVLFITFGPQRPNTIACQSTVNRCAPANKTVSPVKVSVLKYLPLAAVIVGPFAVGPGGSCV